ncbi:MAG: adenylate/guanylate cyclase domain-containing protein, partial [Rhodocyclales bacterium CG17_big_fil_post_rev_8_21_14_2_50_68_7]
EPIGPEASVGKAQHEELKLWHQALRLYRSQAWDQAELTLLNLTRIAPACRLYNYYTERVAALRKAPPGSGWNGVTVFEEK